MRDSRDNPGDTDRHLLIATWLDAEEDLIRRALSDPRVAQDAERLMDLTDALDALGPARAALSACPEGAELALRVLAVTLFRVRPAARLGDRHYRAARKGADAAKAKQRRRVARSHTALRRQARKLDPSLSQAAKARVLARTSRLSPRQIRKIIAK